MESDKKVNRILTTWQGWQTYVLKGWIHNGKVSEQSKELRDQMFKTAYFGVFSVILPNPLFMIWCPYRNCCSAEAFTQIWEKSFNLFSCTIKNAQFIKATPSVEYISSRVHKTFSAKRLKRDLVLGIGCKEVQGSDVQTEFARLCELS